MSDAARDELIRDLKLWACSPRVPQKAQLVMLEAVGRLGSTQSEIPTFMVHKGLCGSTAKCREAGKCLGRCEEIIALERGSTPSAAVVTMLVKTLRNMAATAWADRYEHQDTLTQAADRIEQQDQRILQLEASRASLSAIETQWRKCGDESHADRKGVHLLKGEALKGTELSVTALWQGEFYEYIVTVPPLKNALADSCVKDAST